MGKSFLYVLVLCLAFLAGQGRPHASTVELLSTVLGDVINDGSIRSDDPDGGAAQVTASRIAVMEFDLVSIPLQSVVNSAWLRWEVGGSVNAPVDVELHGYVGDGVLALGDATHSNLIATASIPAANVLNDFSIDVSVFLAELVTAENRFAGFMFRLADETPSNEKLTQFRTPMLIVSFQEPVPVPLPAALPLFGTGLGILGFLGWRRRRKAQAV